ncbi:MAG: PAS domain-containing sensor histidine kinase [Chloroflexota bacterium]
MNPKVSHLHKTSNTKTQSPATLEDALEQIQSLKEQLQCYKTVANHTSNGVMVLDLDGIVMWVNDSFSKLSGRSLNEVVGKTANQFLEGSTRNLASAHMVWSMMQQRQGFTSEMKHVDKSGNPYQIIVNGEPIADEKGNVFGYAMIETDITLLKVMEQALADAHKAAEEKEAAKTNFFANLSHELRTPLNGILGLAQLLETTELSTEQTEYVQNICDSGESLLTLIGNLLALTTSASDRIDDDYEEVDLEWKINRLIKKFEKECSQKGVIFEALIDPSLNSKIVVPWTSLAKILFHLCDNAIKFTPRGHISLTVTKLDDRELHFSVKDTGVGIAGEELPHIFKEFYQADASLTRSYQGIGLGLPLAEKFAKSLGTKITVQSVKEAGSTFSFIAPCRSDLDE